jgi:hypothetical protein
LGGAKLTFLNAGFASFASLRIGYNFKTALGNPFRDLHLVLPEQVSQNGTAAPVAIAD